MFGVINSTQVVRQILTLRRQAHGSEHESFLSSVFLQSRYLNDDFLGTSEHVFYIDGGSHTCKCLRLIRNGRVTCLILPKVLTCYI